MIRFSNGSNQSSDAEAQLHFCYDSVRGSCRKIVQPIVVQFFMVFFIGLAILVTIFGNLLVIMSIAHFKQLQTTTNCLVLSLAVCDFLLGAFIMPCSAVRSVQGCWFLGDFMCKLHSGTDMMLSTCSIIHLSLISLDRYIAICTPLLYQSIDNSLTTLLMITTSWLISAIFGYVMVFCELNLKGSEVIYETQVQCVGGCTSLFFTQTTAVVSSMISFFIPGLIMVAIYIKIYFVARRQAKAIKDQTQQIQAAGGKKSNDSGRNERRKENTLAVVVGVFLICWTPFFLCIVTDPFIGYSIPSTVFEVLFWFGYLNSSLNPLLYALFYSWFRKAFRVILSGGIFYRDSCRTKLYSE